MNVQLFLLLLPAFLTTAYQVQEAEVTFHFFTRNQTKAQITLENICEIDSTKSFKFIIHGWIASHNESWVAELTEAYLKAGDYNVIHVDWSQLAAQTAEIAIANANDVGYYAAKLIRGFIKQSSVSPETIEIAGHSLGAHISAFTGRYIKEEFDREIGKIVGLDPANVVFEGRDGLSEDDAHIVSVIHTDDGGLGKRPSLGNVDFFPNGGVAPQPGCDGEASNCSHVIVTAFFIEAVENQNAFRSIKCDSYENFLNGDCTQNESVTVGGDLEGAEGDFYFQTNPQKPYSMS